jgi:hypothetical protein
MAPANTDGLSSPSKTSNAANHIAKIKSQSSKGKSKALNTEAHCDLCNRKFSDSNALRKHVSMSSVHKTSRQSASSTSGATAPRTAAIANQDQVTLTAAPILPGQPKMTHGVFRCDLCKLSLRDKKSLEKHTRWSMQHQTRVSKAASSGPVSRTNRETNSIPCAQTSLLDIRPSSGGTSAAPQQQIYCVTCNRHFQNQNGFRMHVETSKEHKAKLQQSAWRNSSEQYMSVITLFEPPDWHLRVKVESMSITETPNSPAAPTIFAPDLVWFAAESNTAPVQIYPVHPPTKQDGSLNSPLLTGKEQSRAAQVADTAYHFSQCWSDVPVHDQQSILDVLRKTCHPVEHLSMNGYDIRPLTAAEVDSTRKCNNCGGMDPHASLSPC